MSEDPKAEAGPESNKKMYKDGGPDSQRDTDTEGHRRNYVKDEAGPEGQRSRTVRGDEGDVEGHKK